MVWSLEMDGGFAVGGDPSRRLTPNFRLREFTRADGTVRVHRELVSAVQILREQFASSITVADTDADGLGATVTGSPRARLMARAQALVDHGLFATAHSHDNGVHLRIPNPEQLPAISLEQALETAFSVTAGFETSGDRFQQVTGNFDGAGLSFGPAQWNFKSETLVDLFRKFEQTDAEALRAAFTDPDDPDNPDDYAEWQQVMTLPVAAQIEWASGISTGGGNHDVVEPWKSYFRAVGRVRAFRAVMVEQALRKYGAKMLREVRYLQSLAPHISIDHLRCMCALYDLVIQQGSLARAKERIEARVAAERPADQFALVAIAVEERGMKANAPWRADCVSRRLGILGGFPYPVDGSQRANINFYKLRDVCIRDAKTLMDSDVSTQLATVSEALASGQSILA